jgi:hypothetical protein
MPFYWGQQDKLKFLSMVKTFFWDDRFYWPTMFRDTYAYCISYERCQKLGNISKRNMMPLNPILVAEIFDV